MKQKKKKFWNLMAIDYATPFVHPMSYMIGGTSYKIRKIIGINKVEPTLFEAKEEKPGKQKFRWCYIEEDMIKQAKTILNRLEKNPKFLEKINKQSRATSKGVINYALWLFNQNLLKYSNKKLFDAYSKLFNLTVDMNIWGHIINLVDFSHNMLTNKILSFLEKLTKEKNYKLSTPEVFGILTTPVEKNPLQKQEEDFFKLLLQIQKGKKSVDKAAEEHKKKYDWLEFHYSGPTILGKEYFIDLLASEIRQGTKGGEKIKELREKERKLILNQKKIIRDLELSKKEIYWTNLAKTFMFLKALRKDIVFQVSRLSDPLIREIGSRVNLNPTEVRYLTVEEIGKNLVGKRTDVDLIDERIRYTIWIVKNEKIKIFTGKGAEKYSKRIIEEKAKEKISEFRGTPACVGYVRGVAKIIIGADDMSKMNKGDILVSPATNPNLMSAIKNAGAIITDEGGITCHAAIVSRELGIPCIIGTKIATRVLKDGDLVEVDANKGEVRILEEWPSGLRRGSRKAVGEKSSREFKSHLLRF